MREEPVPERAGRCSAPQRARLAAALGLLLPAAACSAGQRAAGFPGAHLVLISLDTTRADHLGCYGSAGARAPVLDGISRRGILFEEAVTAATTTLASHVSIMTGLYPHSHGVPENGWTVGEMNSLLAERLAAEGYSAMGVAGSFALSSIFHFDQGFEEYDERFTLLLHPRHRDQDQRRAGAVTDAAIEALGRWSGGPLFLFVHYFDPHAPYDPPRPGGEALDDAGPAPDLEDLRALVSSHQRAATGRDHAGLRVVFDGLSRELLAGASGGPSAEDLRFGSLYGGEIAYMDREIGRLLAALDERGILRDAVLLVVGDHGETLWEHGDFYNHGLALYQTTVHVPLLLRLPGDRHAGLRVPTPVSTVDILPTLLTLLGIERRGRMDGVDLSGLLEGERVERGPLFSEATQPAAQGFDPPQGEWRNATRARSVRDGKWKLVRTPYLQLTELYDLESDPGERRNLLAEDDASARSEAARLGRLLDSWASAANPLPSFPSREHIEEVRERLRSLGYL